MKRIRRDRGTAISVWIKKYFPRLVSRYTNTLRICFMYCTNIRIKKKKNVVCVTPRLARNHSRHPIPKALRITRSSFGVATVTTAPFSTWYECAPTFMVVGASNGAVAAVVDVFAVNSVLRFRGEALPTPRLRAARNALAARDCSPRQVSNRENTNTGNATRASRIKRF